MRWASQETVCKYYNTKESVDGQWYVFMIDEDGTVIAHANPALVGQLASDITGPNNYPTGAAVAATADENGAWFDYTFTNLATGSVETKHSWMVIHDGITFGSGWYEEGPRQDRRLQPTRRPWCSRPLTSTKRWA